MLLNESLCPKFGWKWDYSRVIGRPKNGHRDILGLVQCNTEKATCNQLPLWWQFTQVYQDAPQEGKEHSHSLEHSDSLRA